MRARDEKHWSLFRDWCASRGSEPIPASYDMLGQFLKECPSGTFTARERLRAVVAAHDEAGVALRLPPARVRVERSAWQTGLEDGTGRAWLSPSRALGCIDPYAYPEGVMARRDAFLVALVGVCGLTLRQAANIRVADVRVVGERVSVMGVVVPTALSRYECPACAVFRWLAVLAGWARQWHLVSVGASEEAVFEAVTSLPEGGVHECSLPLRSGWGVAGVLSPALELSMLPAFVLSSMSRDAVRAALRSRQHPSRSGARIFVESASEAAAHERAVDDVVTVPGRRMGREDHDELDALFSDMESRIDAILAASEAALRGPGGEATARPSPRN